MREKKRRGCLFYVAISMFLFFVACLAALFIMVISGEHQAKSTLAKELELTNEQESAMVDIFTQCGIGEIISASKFQEGESQTSYHLDDEETAAYKGVNNTIVVWVDNESKAIESIHFHEHDIYMNGEVLEQVTDHYVNSEDCEKYRVASQMAVTRLLNYPDTAKYPARSGWYFGIEEGVVIVQSSVTAKNAFGMESTSEFQVKFTNGAITSLILDGTEYIG